MSISVLIADCVLLNFTNKIGVYQKLKKLDCDQNPSIYLKSLPSIRQTM